MHYLMQVSFCPFSALWINKNPLSVTKKRVLPLFYRYQRLLTALAVASGYLRLSYRASNISRPCSRTHIHIPSDKQRKKAKAIR